MLLWNSKFLYVIWLHAKHVLVTVIMDVFDHMYIHVFVGFYALLLVEWMFVYIFMPISLEIIASSHYLISSMFWMGVLFSMFLLDFQPHYIF